MPRYNELYYQNGYYGTRSALSYSAEPIVATAIDYSAVLVEWLAPTGTYSDFRIVRSQIGIPQTQEDGAVVYSSIGAPSTTSIVDSISNVAAPIIFGRFVFYRAWVRKAESSFWVPAGDTYTLLPSPHSIGVGRDAVYSGAAPDGYNTDDVLLYSDPKVNPIVSTTHSRFLSLLPGVLVNTTNSGVDVVQTEYNKYGEPTGAKENSLISTFLSAFSFTVDEFLTFASLITPDVITHWANPTSVYLGSHQLGMTLDVEPVTITQRRLLRNAIKIYSEKGTKAGLELLIQSMTSYDATLVDTVNLLHTVADATFNAVNWISGPVGNWESTSSDLVISVASNVPIKSDVAGSLDPTYCLKVHSSTKNKSIQIGNADPVNVGLPVTPGLPYTFSFYGVEGAESSEGDTDLVTYEIRWYDRFGRFISSTLDSTTLEASLWTRKVLANKVAPVGAYYAGLVLTFAADYPIYIDMVQFEQNTVATDYQEPRGINITLNPNKKNFVLNPSFTSNLDHWDKGGDTTSITRVSTDSRSLSGSLEATMGTGISEVIHTPYIPVTEFLYYSVSGYVKDLSAHKKWAVSIEFSDEGGTPTETVVGDLQSVAFDYWTRVVFVKDGVSSVRVPAGSTQARFKFVSDEGTVDNCATLFDAIQFEETYAPTDYFDGFLLDDGGEFEGAPNESYSVNYPSKSVRIDRLKNEIQEYLGFDTPYYIYTINDRVAAGIS